MDCSLPGLSIHGVFQARVLEWGAIAFSLLPSSVYEVPWAGTKGGLLQVLAVTQLKFDTVSAVSPSISHEVMGTDATVLVF